MKDALQIVSNAKLPASPDPKCVTQTGDKNTQILHANQVNVNQNIFLATRDTGCLQGPNETVEQVKRYLTARGKEYYNLFVISGETFDNGRFFVPPDRALTESIDPNIKSRLATLNPEAIELIKTLPSLFMSELCRRDSEQNAYYGFVTDIIVLATGIRIEFQRLDTIPQIKLNELLGELALEGKSNINELHRTHWSIKQVDLLKELSIAGYNMLG